MRRYLHSGLARWALPISVVFGCCWIAACQQAAQDAPLAGKTRLPAGDGSLSDADRLTQLRTQRENDAFTDKLAIGPGDVIEVTVPRVPELNKFRVRVSEDNTISVPLAGVVVVGGMTEEELRQALYNRFAKPMKNPDV